MKMVATSLLSEGKVWEGVELLILTGKVGDPCSYLKSAGHWDQALWLREIAFKMLPLVLFANKFS